MNRQSSKFEFPLKIFYVYKSKYREQIGLHELLNWSLERNVISRRSGPSVKFDFGKYYNDRAINGDIIEMDFVETLPTQLLISDFPTFSESPLAETCSRQLSVNLFRDEVLLEINKLKNSAPTSIVCIYCKYVNQTYFQVQCDLESNKSWFLPRFFPGLFGPSSTFGIFS